MRLLLAGVAAVFLCGCEVYAVPSPPPCPGTRQGIFDWGGTLTVVPPSDCFFAVPGQPAFQVNSQIAFQGAVNFGPASDEAWVCIERAHAQPREGVRGSWTKGQANVYIEVEYTTPSGTVGGYVCPSPDDAKANGCVCPPNDLNACSCPVIIDETIVGQLLLKNPDALAAGFSSFTGWQFVRVSPPELPATVKRCTPRDECSYAYDLTATEVGAR